MARQRFKAKGWKNVHCLRQDASAFVLPEWESGAIDPRGSITAITLSYSLSMVRVIFTLSGCSIESRSHHFTNSSIDVIRSSIPNGVYLESSISTPHEMQVEKSGYVGLLSSCLIANCEAIGSARKRVSWFAKWFWECWFEFDNVHLHASRRGALMV